MTVAATSAVSSPFPDFSAIDDYVRAQLRATGIPGAALIVARRDGVVHRQCFGVADRSGRPITTRTPFLLGSPGKGITALAVMQLVERGRIALDAPITTYLPWLDTADRQADRITVRQLLSHTSGISSRAGNQGTIYDGAADNALVDLTSRLRSVRLTRAPGAAYQYSNANYMIAGLIVQTVSGQSYEDYLRQNVFGPLQMTHSFALQAEARRHGMAQGHHLLYGRAIPTDLPEDRGTLPAGLHVTCAEDMGRYLMALLNDGALDGARVLSAESVRAMLTPVVAITANDSYGLGWHVGAPHGRLAAWHDGVTTNFRSYVSLLPDHGYGVALLFNGDNSVQTARLDVIGRTVQSMLLGTPPPVVVDGFVRSRWPLIVVGLAAAQIGWLLWSRRLLDGPHAARPTRLVAPVALEAGYVATLLAGVPALAGAELLFLIRFVPEVGYPTVALAAVATGWAGLRTAATLAQRLARRASPRPMS